MIKFLSTIAIITGIIVISYIFVCISVIIKRNNVVKRYSAANSQLIKHCDFIEKLLPFASNRDEVDKINILKNEVISLGISWDNIDRRLAFYNELIIKFEYLIDDIANNTTTTDILNEYYSFQKQIKTYLNAYNNAVQELKIAADTFPSSFAARLLKIKMVNKFKI